MHGNEELLAGLLERYGRYQSLLDQAAMAIEARAQDTLSMLELACTHVLDDIHGQWAELDEHLQTRSSDAGPAGTTWALLESAMARAAEQLSLNQAALSQWAGEVGAMLHDARQGAAAIGAYENSEVISGSIYGMCA